MKNEHRGILPFEKGIVEKQGIYFRSLSDFTIKNLFYALCGAKYVCEEPYSIDRSGLNAFLFFYIKSGIMHFEYRGQVFDAHDGDVVLLNCSFHHRYYTVGRTDFYWFHFHGASSAAYTEQIWINNGALFKKKTETEEIFDKIINMLRTDYDTDDMISVEIHKIFAMMNKSGGNQRNISSQIKKACNHMQKHFADGIVISQLADMLSMTRFYFSRRFKEETGMTPHGYLTEVRITHAKERLTNGDESIEQIAFDCAFDSASSFIRTFKLKTGMTPHKFRSLSR